MTVKTNWDQRELDDEMDKDVKKFLHASGQAMQNAFAQKSPVITGLLKNSLSYLIDDGSGNSTKDGVSRPTKELTVRGGSGIIYAASVENRGKSAGWMSSVWDDLISRKVFENIANKTIKI